MNQPAKPGAKTSEFWITVIWAALSGGVSLGLVPEQTDVQHATSVIATALVAVMTAVAYISGRNTLKSQTPSRDEALDAVHTLARLAEDLRRSGTPGGPKE